MGEKPDRLRSAAGYSLLEVMIGGVLLGLIALALLPAFLSLSSSLKVSAFQTECNAIVRAKLQEYVNGRNIPGVAGAASGFEYTKYRFSRYAGEAETTGGGTSYYYCQENPAAGLSASTSWFYPGFRERINSNTKIANSEGEEVSAPDLPERLRGFQLYVNIRHYNPRFVNTTAADKQPRRQCPSGSTYTTPSDYQFYRLGDALEVVVTGMIRTTPAVDHGGRGGKRWGPFQDLNGDTPHPRLVCSATQVVYPPRLPFRYYLGVDGKIRNYQATATFVAGLPNASLEAMEAHFRSIWSQKPSGGTTSDPGTPNLRSFAVSPENNRIYVLRPGELSLYSDCSDKTITVNGKDFPQTPDCNLSTSTITTWQVDSNIESITTNFTDIRPTEAKNDKVYAILNTGGNALGEIKLLTLPAGGGAAAAGPTGAGVNFVVPGGRPRIHGIFMVQTFPSVAEPNIFYFDNTCPGSSGGNALLSYCVGIFNSADTNMAMPVREMPVQTEAISY